MMIDLVSHGPHAVIGGTTGSGKSELLVSWVLAMARVHAPSVVNFLLVDFKGGASFASLADLPHVVGIVTDLDERTAHRAMLSLRAELKFRERLLAQTGARSVDDAGVDLPRLVIMVDEFAAMAADYPQLHDLFADLAARGRSLGLHLVLCTQRPAGVIRDAVLANATLRLSLRVNNRADSLAVLGSDQAAELPGDSPGRALISIGGDRPEPVTVARAREDDILRVIGQYPAPVPSIRRPWCDDLPAVVPLASLEFNGEGIPFALVDLPEQQRQDTAQYDPALRGSLLVIGATGSGKSELLSTLSAACGVERLPSTAEAAWDAVEAAIGRLRAGVRGARLLLADDLDALVGRFPEEYVLTFVDRLVELARDGSAVGLWLGLSVRRIPPALQTLTSLCDERVLLRLASRQDYLIAGGTAVGYAPDAPPGSGEWRGARIQVGLSSAESGTAGLEPVGLEPVGGESAGLESAGGGTAELPSALAADGFDLAGYRTVAIMTTRVAEFARRLRALQPQPGEVQLLSGSPPLRPMSVEVPGVPGVPGTPGTSGILGVIDAQAPSVIIGDPDGWQANWALLGAVRRSGLVVFDRCSVADFRGLTGRRTLPPPIRTGADQCWSLQPDGSVSRMLAPSA
nr:FtsK/SpoIIIE domain-containing protein [Frigoribacterium sp. CG_9.8]